MELKATKQCTAESLKKLADTVLQQINEKKYDTELKVAGVTTVYKYGVAFCGKQVEVVVE